MQGGSESQTNSDKKKKSRVTASCRAKCSTIVREYFKIDITKRRRGEQELRELKHSLLLPESPSRSRSAWEEMGRGTRGHKEGEGD